MGKKIKCLCIFVWFLLVIFSPGHQIIFGQTDRSLNLDDMYWDGRFPELIKYFRERQFDGLSQNEKLLMIECLARTGMAAEALKHLNQMTPVEINPGAFYACAGWVHFALGNFRDAEGYWNRSIEESMAASRAVLGKVMLLLFFKRYAEAEQLFTQYLKAFSERNHSFQVFLIGIEVFNATRNCEALASWYSQRAKSVKKKNRQTHVSLKANARMYKKIRGKNIFEVQTESDTVQIPFTETGQDRFMFIDFQPGKDRKYRILLDTGNAAGWMIHDRELFDGFEKLLGGKVVASVGTEVEPLNGYRIYHDSIVLNGLKLFHLVGNYIPKPRPDFFDANLNPSFIRNRVVTLDGIQKKLILRSKDAFDRYLSEARGKRIIKIPWYGYEQVFVPVVVNGVYHALGIIETGAEDLAIKLDFARRIKIPLTPKMRYLSNGRVFRFFETPADVALGSLRFQRNTAEVWSFDRFARHLTGLKADVVLGPRLFQGEYVVSFDPFDRQIVVEGENR